MRPEPTCPRCAGALHPPGLWSSDWTCAVHGAVQPFSLAPRPCIEALHHAGRAAHVPVWLPSPMPTGWLVSGIGSAGDERTGALGTLVACSGPAPLGGAADMVLVAEQPGVGLGARFAGLAAPDPGPEITDEPPGAKVLAAGHPTPLWTLPGEDRVCFVGAAMGQWLWTVLWPADAGLLLLEDLALHDCRDGVPELPDFGALSPRLTDGQAGPPG